MKLKSKPRDSLVSKVYRFINDFTTLKIDRGFKWNFLRFYIETIIFNRYDALRIKDEGRTLITILIKKYRSENKIKICVFIPGEETSLDSHITIGNLNFELLRYSTLGYKNVSILLKKYNQKTIKFFSRWLDFEIDETNTLEKVILQGKNDVVILYKSLNEK